MNTLRKVVAPRVGLRISRDYNGVDKYQTPKTGTQSRAFPYRLANRADAFRPCLTPTGEAG